MRIQPTDLSESEIAGALERRWSFRARSLAYLPVGFGSHHWEARDAAGDRRFVTVDVLVSSHLAPDPESAFATLERALRTATALRQDAGLEFVVAAIPGNAGQVTHRLDQRYALSVFPFVVGESPPYGPYASPDERRAVLGTLGRLHQVASTTVTATAPREDFTIPRGEGLLEALDDLGSRWDAGPFAEPARGLLAESEDHLRDSKRAFDEMAAEAQAGAHTWVITHGEPHSGNVIWRGDGRDVERARERGCFLVDWDTVKVAPRERDLWMVLPDDRRELADYLKATGQAAVNERALRLYRTWWLLSDVAAFVGLFRRAHDRNAETELAWESLSGYLSEPGSRVE